MSENPTKPDDTPPGDPPPLNAVPWYRYHYSFWDWAVFIAFFVYILLIVKSCTGH